MKGLGPVKVVSLLEAFNKPFVASSKGQDDGATAAPPTAIIEQEREPGDLPATPPTPSRPRQEGPSRSPSVGPDDDRQATGEVWGDPFSDDDEGDDNPASKRQRV